MADSMEQTCRRILEGGRDDRLYFAKTSHDIIKAMLSGNPYDTRELVKDMEGSTSRDRDQASQAGVIH